MGDEVSTLRDADDKNHATVKESSLGGGGGGHGRIVLSQQMSVQPTTQFCFYCDHDGRELPIELFTSNPCCGYKMCKHCRRKNREWCGECLTHYPKGDTIAFPWILSLHNENGRFRNKGGLLFLLGRLHVLGEHTYVDEMDTVPMYERWYTPCKFLQMMNPGNIDLGIKFLKMAAIQHDYLPAVLALADVYAMHVLDKEKAEFWHRQALGKGTTVSPLALTRYGLFLQSEGRLDEACDLFENSARLGHVRAQHEYAKCLLQENNKAESPKNGMSDDVNEAREAHLLEAIQWLCKSSKTGYYLPSLILMSEVLIDFAEENSQNGRADNVGTSPLPRVYQILKLANSDDEDSSTKRIPPEIFSDKKKQKEKIQSLLEKYEDDISLRCANCGEEGTEAHPLISCSRCTVACYCSKLCMKKNYRDGHKIDCCSSKDLYNFDHVKRFITSGSASNNNSSDMAECEINDFSLSTTNAKNKSLARMVDDVTDELNGGEDEDYDYERLALLMSKMRKNLEIYLDQRLPIQDSQGSDGSNHQNGVLNNKQQTFTNLKNRIDLFASKYDIPIDFKKALHDLRELGNLAVHDNDKHQLDRKKCEDAVRMFIFCQQMYGVSPEVQINETNHQLKASTDTLQDTQQHKNANHCNNQRRKQTQTKQSAKGDSTKKPNDTVDKEADSDRICQEPSGTNQPEQPIVRGANYRRNQRRKQKKQQKKQANNGCHNAATS